MATIWILAVLLVLGWGYAPVLVELFRDWLRDPNYSHGLLVPPIAGFLAWQRRRTWTATPSKAAPIGLAGVLGAGALLAVGAAGAEVFTQRVSFIVAVASVCVFLWGWRRFGVMAFPVAFVLLAIPLPYVIYYDLTAPMQTLAAKTAIHGLRALGIPSVAEGNIIHLPGMSLEVAEACSGIRSLYAFLALGALFARSLRLPTWGRWLVFVSTIPLSIAGNAVRVLGTGVAAHLGGAEMATGTVHEMFGLIVFVFALGILALIGKGAKQLWRDAPSS